MKKTFVLILAIYSFTLFGQDNENNRGNKLKRTQDAERVKSLKIKERKGYFYEYDSGKEKGKGKIEQIIKYNDNGYPIYKEDHDREIDFISIDTSLYDKNGNLLQKSFSSFAVITNKYDLKNNRIEERGVKNGKFLSLRKYKYDSKDNLIEDSEESPDGTIITKCLYKYNSNNINIEVSCIGGLLLTDDRDEQFIMEFSVDKKGNIIEQKEYKSSKGEQKRCTDASSFYYDDKGNQVESISENYVRYDGKGHRVESTSENYVYPEVHSTIVRRKYDDKNRMIEYLTYDKSKETSKISNSEKLKFTYDSNGNLLEETTYDDKDEQKYTTKYEYIYIFRKI